MRQDKCKQCPDYIPPERAGFRGLDGSEPGVMSRNGRCGITLRIVQRMKECPKKEQSDESKEN